MDTDALKAFVAIAELGSFSLAGERLFLTQPAVSKRIATLEGLLDCQLFDRVGRTITLTEAGRELLPRAQAILAATADALQAINDLSGDVRGELNLSTSHHIGLHHLPKHLRRFNDNYPQVKLKLDFQDSEVALAQVLQGKVEMAALTLAQQPHPKLEEAVVWDDPLCFVAAVDHPLAQLSQPQMSDLSRFTAILPEENTFTTRLVSQLFQQQGTELELRMATNYLETIKMMVSIGLGWGVLPKTLLEGAGLKEIAIDSPPLVRRLGIIHHKERSLSNASKAFLRLFAEETAER
ncbi:LysR family transcriptional regulator [Halioxenophilus sp. WMMB6]|uniref:LysR family transcriptional regulator n=1 Tax=Halioxenophilus sp. WMMB6 TaxID=3073815 RepID=UPI00295E30DB|nr:LysR family transcriptional regulator [Halioxenophilus sp. WMMB6]